MNPCIFGDPENPTSNDEITLESELETLKSSYARKTEDQQLSNTNKLAFIRKYGALFGRRDVWKPSIIMAILFLLQQFCGLSTISYYAVNVLQDSHSSVDKVS